MSADGGTPDDSTGRCAAAHHPTEAYRREAFGSLAGAVAHDVNNILCGIAGHVELIREELRDAGLPVARIDSVAAAMKRATGVVSELLEFGRGVEEPPQRLDAGAVVEDAVGSVRGVVPQRIDIVVERGDGDLWVEAAESQLHRVVANLCINAAQALGDGPGAIRIALSRVADEAGGAQGEAASYLVRIVVTDTGPGIPPDIIGHVFEPFFTTRAGEAGTGLGLAIVRGIAEGYGGTATAENVPGGGARLTVGLPAAPLAG